VALEKASPAVASDSESRQYFLDDSEVSNEEMQQIWEEDKKDRQMPYEKVDWSVVDKADAARREVTRKLLRIGCSAPSELWRYCWQSSDSMASSAMRWNSRSEILAYVWPWGRHACACSQLFTAALLLSCLSV
jgi:hypothetical protein